MYPKAWVAFVRFCYVPPVRYFRPDTARPAEAGRKRKQECNSSHSRLSRVFYARAFILHFRYGRVGEPSLASSRRLRSTKGRQSLHAPNQRLLNRRNQMAVQKLPRVLSFRKAVQCLLLTRRTSRTVSWSRQGPPQSMLREFLFVRLNLCA